MKFTKERDDHNKKTVFILELDDYDLAVAQPSHFATEANRVARKTGKVSDILFWLSEEVKTIEEVPPTQPKEKE